MTKDLNTVTRLENQLSLKQLQITTLLNITQAINENLPQDDLFKMYKDFLTWELSIDKLALFIKEDNNWHFVVKSNIANEADLDKLPQVFLQYTRLHHITSDDDEKLQEYEYIIPVYHKKDPIAYSLISGGRKGEETFNNIKLITSITNIIAVAIENKRLVRRQIIQEKEWELAKEVTSMLIPDEMPSGPNYTLANIYKPHYKVGGDYIDYIMFSEHKICFCIADVSGKGIAAAMIMANFQALLQNLGQQYKDLETLLMVLNQAVLRITKGEKYLTLFIAVADLQKKLLYYVNAGHIPPLLLQNNEIKALKATSTIIGHFEQLPQITEGVVHLDSDTTLVSFTDGLIEVKNNSGRNFSMEMLENIIRKNSDLNAQQLCMCIMNEVTLFNGKEEIPDDIAILSFKYVHQ